MDQAPARPTAPQDRESSKIPEKPSRRTFTQSKAGTFDQMATRRREEVLNVLLAQCICDAGLTADPENILDVEGNRRMPDVLVYLQGLRCSIDGKYEDHADYRGELEGQVLGRLADGLAHIGVGVVYPKKLRSLDDFSKLKKSLREEDLQFFIGSETDKPNWQTGKLNDLLEQLRSTQASLATDDVVSRGVELLQEGMNGLIAELLVNPAACENLTHLMGVYEESRESEDVPD